jgi:hypothetical protein
MALLPVSGTAFFTSRTAPAHERQASPALFGEPPTALDEPLQVCSRLLEVGGVVSLPVLPWLE